MSNTSLRVITAAGATTTQQVELKNSSAKGVVVVLDMTAIGTGNVTLSIEGKDKHSGKFYTILAGAAVSSNSTNVYRVYPGMTAVANISANDLIPKEWRVTVTANNANPTTYTVGASLIA